jgi:hypothetical protein
MTPEEKSRFEAAVQKEVAKLLATQQKQMQVAYAKMMRDGLKGVDKANAELRKERAKLLKEMDAVRKEFVKAEKEGDKMAEAYYEGRQKQFRNAAQVDLLRELTWQHLKNGQAISDIAIWLGVKESFVKEIKAVMKRNKNTVITLPILEGNPILRYKNQGRGGTVYFEAGEAKFDMWWEMAGGDALVILEIPTLEDWEERTNIPAERRDFTLEFIAKQVLRDQVSSNGSYINFYGSK